MNHTSQTLLGVLTIVSILAGGHLAADDQSGQSAGRLFTLSPSTHGNPEGIAFDPVTGAFFVGATGDGTIYRGTLNEPIATEFIVGSVGSEAGGLACANGLLYVAGGFSGVLSVYDIATSELVAAFHTGTGGLLNDVAVTEYGDVYVTDSLRPVLWHISPAQVQQGGGVPGAILVSPDIQYEFAVSPINLNGIVALEGGERLIVVQSNTGKLFRIDLDGSAPYGRTIHEIAVEPLWGGDGLLLDAGRLIVVQGWPAALTFVKLDTTVTRGQVVEYRTDPSFRGPSTVVRARNFYLVVNADFTTGTTPFTVTALPRSVRN